jgi:hypothetical protein
MSFAAGRSSASGCRERGGLRASPPHLIFLSERMKRKRQQKSNIVPTDIGPDFFDLHALVVLGELWGWEPKVAFLIAVMMRSNGITAAEAGRAFADAQRWLQ